MAKLTVLFGVLLMILGVAGYVSTESRPKTALIPTYFGIVLTALGAIAVIKPGARMHIMHAAVVLAFVGLLGTAGGVLKLFQMLGGTQPARPAAVYAQSIMAVLMVAFIALCVKSFVDARKKRLAGNS